MKAAQLADTDISPVYRAKLENSIKPSREQQLGLNQVAKIYMSQWETLELHDGLLYHRWESADCQKRRLRLVLPFKYRDDVMQHLHDSNYAGHLGVRRTQLQVCCRYYWYKLREDVSRYIRTCDPCQKRKRPGNTPQAAMYTQNVGFRFERIAMDICGKMTRT